ncbi:MAG: VanZ family protein [Muribaculum sp.]|nr:VanZ family protein [Muribaculum sp.]
MLRRLLSYIPVFALSVITTIAILYLTLAPQPLPDVEIPMFEGIDKVVHFLMMYGLTGIIAFDCLRLKHYSRQIKAPLNLVVAITVGTIAFGVLIEIMQLHMDAGRSFDPSDIIADTLGSLAAAATIIPLWPSVSSWYH